MTTRESWWLSGLYLDEDGFYRYDNGPMTGEQFSTALGGLGRNEGPALLHDLWATGAIEISDYPGVVAEVYSMCEFPSTRFDPPSMWVDLFNEAGFTHDGAPAPRPPEPITLYRGCHHERRFGMSWTTDLEHARWFAERDLGHGTGTVYAVTAEPGWLLAYIGDGSRKESEYVIDPQYLSDEVVERHPFHGSA